MIEVKGYIESFRKAWGRGRGGEDGGLREKIIMEVEKIWEFEVSDEYPAEDFGQNLKDFEAALAAKVRCTAKIICSFPVDSKQVPKSG